MSNSHEETVAWRLHVLETAEKIGVSEVCRISHISRRTFYNWKSRYEADKGEGLKERCRAHKPNPALEKQRDALADQVVEAALAHPKAGCTELIKWLEDKVSFVTVRKILIERGLSSREQRWLVLEEKAARREWLSPEQATFVKEQNPVFKEYRWLDPVTARSAEKLAQYAFSSRCRSSLGFASVYAHVVVDTFSLMAWVALSGRKNKRGAIDLLFDEVVPFCKELDCADVTVLTDHSLLFSYESLFYKDRERVKESRGEHAYDNYLHTLGWRHFIECSKLEQNNGFVERFHHTLRDEFLHPSLKEKPHLSVEERQKQLDAWLNYYNHQRRSEGFPNYGKCPYEAFQSGLVEE